VSTYNYPALSYFLQAYWNRNGDIIYETPAVAAKDFAKSETTEYCHQLLMDINLAIDRQLVRNDISWHTCDRWWSQHDVLINLKEASDILVVLKQRSGFEHND
jgi:hypothetical protein